MKKNISMRQTGVLILFSTFTTKLLLLPALMFEDVKSDAIFSIILLFGLELLSLPVFFKLKSKYPDKRLHDILKKYLSGIVAKFIILILMFFVLIKSILTFSIVYVYFKQQIYQDEFVWIALIACIAVISHAVLGGLRPMSRTMELFVGVVIAGFVFCLIISLFTPISTPTFFLAPAKDIFFAIYKYAFTFGDFAFLFLIIDKVDYKKSEEKKVYFYAIFAMILVLALFFLFYSKYQVTSFMHNNALADLLVFSVQFNAVGRLDIVAMLTIMMITLFEIEIMCYIFCDGFTSIFPLLNKKYAIVVFDVLFLLLYYLFIGKYETMVNSTVVWLPIVGVIAGYVLPLVCFVISMIKRSDHEKND